MGHSTGFEPGGPIPRDALAAFLGELSACIREWESVLQGQALRQTPGLAQLILRTRAVQASTPPSFRGVALRLEAMCEEARQAGSVPALRGDLAVVKELEAQIRHEVVPLGGPSPVAPAPLPPGPGSPSLEPPRFITHYGERPEGLVMPPPGASVSSDAAMDMPRRLDESRMVSPPAWADATRASAPPPGAAAPSHPPGLQGFSPVPVVRSPSPHPSPPPAMPASARGQSPHAVKSRFGFKPLTAPPAAPPAAQKLASVPPQPPAFVAPQPAVPALPRTGIPDLRNPSRPPDLGKVPGLPDLPDLPAFDPNALPTHLRRGASRGDRADRGERRSTPSPLREGPSVRPGRREGGEGHKMAYLFAFGGFGLAAFIVMVVAVAVYVSRRETPTATGPLPGNSAGPGPSVATATPTGADSSVPPPIPRSRLLTEDERFRSLLAQVHGRGKESGALRALLDEQAALVAGAVSQESCVGPQCAALRQVNQLVTGKASGKLTRRHAHAPDSLRSKWLAGFQMPEIPVEDDPRVQARFEYYTENAVGREQFQQALFRCGAFRDSIQTLLVRRGLPTSLLAVVFAESSCVPTAKSPVGAEGLWQFMPETARAYGLRIIPNMVDERHSPGKATESAVRYLNDLYTKLGAWDLTFAAYNMGPFGLLTRIAKVEGEDVGFWDLADAELLPDETVFYVPNIEAIALILANLQRLKFTGQIRAPEITAELNVPPSTRMSLIARAAAMSLNDLRRMNLDVTADSTPNVPNFVIEIPKDNVWQARDTLTELLKSHDDADLCVPGSFDWGRQRFTPELAQACRANAARATPAARASGR